MGLSVVDCRAGTLVWVQRRNGSWWPGRVVEITELPPSHHPITRTPTTPIKLLGREDSTVDWYNVEKSTRIKAFRCGEFDDCITRAESSQASFSKNFGKYMRRKVAILHALELEKQEVHKKHQAAGKERGGIICQRKRTRCVYLPAKSDNCGKKTTISPKVLKVSSSTFEVHEYPKQSGSAEVGVSSRARESEPSEYDSRGPDRVQRGTQLSGKFGMQLGNINGNGNHEDKRLSSGVQKWELKGKENIGNAQRHGDVVDIKSVKLKKGLADTLCQSPCRSYLEETGIQFADTVQIQFHNMMQMTLTDVELTIQASYGREHVPLVSLMSRLNGKSIIGLLIDVEASDEGSLEILLARNHETSCKFSNNGSTTLKPALRTSKRTSVCYGPQDDKCQNPGSLGLKAREKRLRPKKFIVKALKKPSLSNEKARMLFSFDGEQAKGSMALANRVTCVPVKHIFSKLLPAVGGV